MHDAAGMFQIFIVFIVKYHIRNFHASCLHSSLPGCIFTWEVHYRNLCSPLGLFDSGPVYVGSGRRLSAHARAPELDESSVLSLEDRVYYKVLIVHVRVDLRSSTDSFIVKRMDPIFPINKQQILAIDH